MKAHRTSFTALAALSLVLFGVGSAHAQGQDDQSKPAESAPAADKAPAEDSAATPATPEASTSATDSGAKETNCHDRVDNDGDTVTDCADSDCYDSPDCQAHGTPEITNSLCSDWIDNDGNGAMDCMDSKCEKLPVCQGSYDRMHAGQPSGGAASPAVVPDMPNLKQGMAIEELIGKGGDKDGERNDQLCSDGIDNDGDGRVDCADFGCRFDPSVTVCTQNPGLRFSVVAQLSQSHYFEMNPDSTLPEDDTRVTALQLRAMGPIRGIQNSFFLLSMRAERTPRVTFAMFQIPVSSRGYYININSGGGTLSSGLINSIAKRTLVDPAYYLYSSFEQGNGAAVEFGGPIDAHGRVQFRTFVGGGSGRYNGNVGGRYFRADETGNYTYSAGAQLKINLVGYFNRFDTPFLYTKVPTTVATLIGGKYDQRAMERYPAGNVQFVLRHKLFILTAEGYGKKELEFDSTQMAYNVMAGFLLWPKHLFLAADFGEFIAGDLKNAPPDISDTGSDVKKQRDERDIRGALHWYFYRNIGVLSALYRYRDVKSSRDGKPGYKESEARLVAQYRF